MIFKNKQLINNQSTQNTNAKIAYNKENNY